MAPNTSQTTIAQQKARRLFASKVVMNLVDTIINDVIRPGPHPDERDSYQIANDIRAVGLDLVTAVVLQLNVDKGCE